MGMILFYFNFSLFGQQFNFIQMSILFIGERNRNILSKGGHWSDQQTIKNQKKHAQQQYRLELFQQMKDRNDRRRREKQKQIQADIRYERAFYQQLSNYQKRDKLNQYSPKSIHDQITIAPISQKPSRKQPTNLPPLTPFEIESNPYSFKFNRLNTEEEANQKPRNRSRMKTQNTYDRESSTINYGLMQSPQVRQKKLQQQLDSKLGQVYDLMAKSVAVLNQNQELQTIGRRLSPIRLNLNKSYKSKHQNQGSDKVQQERNQYYRLPKITKNLYPKEIETNDSDINWREWYAKEKLRELQNMYRSELGLDSYPQRYRNRTDTPSFSRQQ